MNKRTKSNIKLALVGLGILASAFATYALTTASKTDDAAAKAATQLIEEAKKAIDEVPAE